MRIKKGGIYREVSERKYNRRWKELGYEIVEENDDLEDMPHDEIYEIAQEYDISGRSKMSKEELIEAIRGVE